MLTVTGVEPLRITAKLAARLCLERVLDTDDSCRRGDVVLRQRTP